MDLIHAETGLNFIHNVSICSPKKDMMWKPSSVSHGRDMRTRPLPEAILVYGSCVKKAEYQCHFVKDVLHR